jgi:predicted  nucleic acid-binding Zn-ribbon protein
MGKLPQVEWDWEALTERLATATAPFSASGQGYMRMIAYLSGAEKVYQALQEEQLQIEALHDQFAERYYETARRLRQTREELDMRVRQVKQSWAWVQFALSAPLVAFKGRLGELDRRWEEAGGAPTVREAVVHCEEVEHDLAALQRSMVKEVKNVMGEQKKLQNRYASMLNILQNESDRYQIDSSVAERLETLFSMARSADEQEGVVLLLEAARDLIKGATNGLAYYKLAQVDNLIQNFNYGTLTNVHVGAISEVSGGQINIAGERVIHRSTSRYMRH